jgi:hypothetical protein
MRSRSVGVNGSADGEADGDGGPSVMRGVHRDGIAVVERVEELPVLVGKHRMVHDVGGWRVQMLKIMLSRDALTRSRRLANRIELRSMVKVNKYGEKCRRAGAFFQPLVLEARSGDMSKTTANIIKKLRCWWVIGWAPTPCFCTGGGCRN